MNNLYNFNNLNRLVSNQYSNLLMLPSPSKMSSGGSTGINSANLSPMPRSSHVPGVKINIDNGNILSNNSNFFKSSYSPVANSIPGLNAFMSTSMSNYSKNAPVDKYLNLLQGLARNDVELKNRIEQVLEAFNDEDDFFFNYVLEFWISGKSFNKRKAKKLQEETGNGQLPSNLTM
ncbi:hypothetical protein PMKS-000864 [Pichia membranifaciens]|uniref:Uncharacterized protein n=1 Tax=Pichia membranifaciens TaxID=4926 RepID=A0A1Q2YCW5_9ASCO|nr:hypothetical protein PMKS-000864 [Pichia membranifaciens]